MLSSRLLLGCCAELRIFRVSGLPISENTVHAINVLYQHAKLVQKATLWRQYMQQVAVKNIAKLEFILGIVHGITEAIGIGGYAHGQEKNAEVIDTLETVRAHMRAAEAGPAP